MYSWDVRAKAIMILGGGRREKRGMENWRSEAVEGEEI